MNRQQQERLRRLRGLLAEVASAFGFEPADLIARDRHPDVCEARRVAMLVLRRRCPEATLAEVGAVLGREHSTVSHGIVAAQEALAESERLQHIVAGLLVEAPVAPATPKPASTVRTIPVTRTPAASPPPLWPMPLRRAQAA